jgi:molecular chaperone GrpE (heat shock protein)
MIYKRLDDINTGIELTEVVKKIEFENEALPNDFVNVMDSINAILEDRGYDEDDEYSYDVRQEILDIYEATVLNKIGLSFN